ncbi:7391_t:CDS:2 [Ambispora leptoticha]|uniref:7391_t:CDS:1 n=1 Tax=Ambispora leptoticha TaxID=144679 RepID=A0A9N8Z8R8_9GLOM|nr:7391_t:CDS:2 [Ambispora leptoticha]
MLISRLLLTSDWTSVILTLFAVYISFYYYKYFSRKNKLPGPLPLPLVGNLIEVAKLGLDNVPKWFFLLRERYGDYFEFYLGTQRIVVTCNAELMDKLVDPSTKTNFFKRHPENSNISELGYNAHGIFFNQTFEGWKFNRKFLSKSLMSPKFQAELLQQQQELFCDASNYLDLLSSKIGDESLESTKINLAATMLSFNADLIIKMTTGKTGGSLAHYLKNNYPFENYKESKRLIQKSNSNSAAYEISIELTKLTRGWSTDTMYIFSLPKWLRHYVPGFSHFNKKCLNNLQRTFHILHGIIEERKNEIENSPKEMDLESNLLTLLLLANTERDPDRMIDTNGEFTRPMTKYEIGGILLEVCHGSIEEISWVFNSTVYYILKFPHVQNQFLEEIEKILGFDLARPITFEDLKKFKYLDAILYETLRLSPPLPVVGRTNTVVDEIVLDESS